MESNYVLVTAARNEQEFIEFPLKAVTSQKIKPKKWVIVSDNSTDNTDDLVLAYAKQHKFIHLIRNTGKDRRNFGSQIKAIQRGAITLPRRIQTLPRLL